MTRAELYGTIKLKKEMRREKKVFFHDLLRDICLRMSTSFATNQQFVAEHN